MSTISYSSSYLNSTSNGFSGLVSGMDTQSLVEEMLSGTKSKIDQQNAEKAQLAMKQGMYRDVIAQLTDFQKSYFDVLNPESIVRANTFFTQNTTTISDAFSDIFSANATDAYTGGDVTLDYIKQLATSSSVTTAGSVTSGDILTNLDTSVLLSKDITMEISIPGADGAEATKHTVNLTAGDFADGEALASAINSQVAAAGATYDAESGSLKFAEDVTGRVTKTSSMATAMTGLANNESGNSISININNTPDLNSINHTLSVNLDGISKSITLTTAELTGDVNDLATLLNERLTDAYGSGVEVSVSGSELVIGTTDNGRQFTMYGSEELTNALGLSSTSASTKMSLDSKLSDINFAGGALTANADGNYALTINGKELVFDAEATMRDVMDTINKDTALNVEMSYNSMTDKFTLESKSMGRGFEVEVANSGASNLGSLMFGSSEKTTLTFENYESVLANATESSFITFKIGEGEVFPPISINLAGKSMSDVAAELERQIKEHGATDAYVSFDESTGKLIITGVSAMPVAITGNPPEDIENMVTQMVTEATVGNEQEGKNAVLSIDGVATERSNNFFSLNGLEFELKETTAAGSEPMEIGVASDTDKVIEGIKAFVDEYNTLVEDLNALLAEPTSYKEYAPLTSEQKKDMSESEIELWEEKAREGLLRNDEYINSVLQEMRTIMYQKPEGAEYALYQFGISTSSDYKDNGKLVIDEAELRDMLNTNPGEIEKLFVSQDGSDENPELLGLGDRLNNVLTGAVKVSSVDPGSLVGVAGYDSMEQNQYSLGREMEDIDEIIERLENQYQMEYDRYWSQFNAMELAIAEMNTQSSWLSSQFA